MIYTRFIEHVIKNGGPGGPDKAPPFEALDGV
jgi:hypothetical protein